MFPDASRKNPSESAVALLGLYQPTTSPESLMPAGQVPCPLPVAAPGTSKEVKLPAMSRVNPWMVSCASSYHPVIVPVEFMPRAYVYMELGGSNSMMVCACAVAAATLATTKAIVQSALFIADLQKPELKREARIIPQQSHESPETRAAPGFAPCAKTFTSIPAALHRRTSRNGVSADVQQSPFQSRPVAFRYAGVSLFSCSNLDPAVCRARIEMTPENRRNYDSSRGSLN